MINPGQTNEVLMLLMDIREDSPEDSTMRSLATSAVATVQALHNQAVLEENVTAESKKDATTG